MSKPKKLPDYDPQRDGWVFGWILRAAAQVRDRRQRWVPKREDEH